MLGSFQHSIVLHAAAEVRRQELGEATEVVEGAVAHRVGPALGNREGTVLGPWGRVVDGQQHPDSRRIEGVRRGFEVGELYRVVGTSRRFKRGP